MKTFNKTLISLSVLGLIACGGSGSDSTTVIKERHIIKDGIYENATDSVIALVDSNVGVLVADLNNSEYVFTHSVSETKTALKSTGLTVVAGSVTTSNDAKLNFDFTKTTMDASGSVGGKIYTYSMDKTAHKLPIAGIAGSRLDKDGYEWNFKNDGTFVINGECTFEGTYTPVKSLYYSVTNVTATGCAYAGNNYEGYVIVAPENGVKKIMGLIGNGTWYVWGNVAY